MTGYAAGAVPILMYHLVTDQASAPFAKYTVTRRAFEAQMRWLASAGFTTLDLPTLLELRRSAAPIPTRAVVITFDDGFRDCVRHAAPVLEAHGFTATFFLVAGLTGGSSTWLHAERGIEFPLMTWADARALEASGHRCESHSMTHPRLTDVPESECRDELARSRAAIEEQLGREVRCFAYPFGSYNARVRKIAAECGYHAACTVTIGLSVPSETPLTLRRVPVLGGDSLFDFISRLRTAYTVRDRLTAMMRSVGRERFPDRGTGE